MSFPGPRFPLSFVRDAGDLASAAELRGVSRAELGRAVRAAQRRVAQDQADDAAGLALQRVLVGARTTALGPWTF